MSVVVGIAIIMGIVMCALYMRNEKKHREVWVEPKSHRRYSGASRDSFASDLSNASTATFVNDVDIDRNVSKYLNLVRTPTLESMQSYATGSTEVGNVVGTPPKWYTYMESQKKTKAGAGIADRVAPPAPTLPPTATAARSRALPIPPSRPRTGYKHHYNRPPPGIRPLAPPHLVAQPQPTRVYGPGTRQPPRNLQQFTAYRAPSNLNAAPPAYTAYTYTHANTTANAHAGTHAITTNAASPAMPVAVRLPRIVPVATTPPGQRSAHPQHGNLRVHIATPVRSPESPSPLSPMMLAAFPRSPHTPVGEVRARSTRDVVTHRPNRSDVTFTVMTVGPRDSIVESYSYADDYHGF
jgi:hypothetical protein